MHERLVILTRNPVAGEVKTRLIPHIGPLRAAALHEAMTRWTLATAQRLQESSSLDVEVQVAGQLDDHFCQSIGCFTCKPQSDGDLGQRMLHALDQSQQQGSQRTVLIGTDAPGLDVHTLQRAFGSLQRCQLVLGPAWDGGYYLIGCQQPIPELFHDIPWGTDTVFEQTVQRAERLGLSIAILDPLPDVDRVEDLPHWTKTNRQPILPLHPGRISVVIPTRNEEKTIRQTIQPLLHQQELEVIVVDAASTDQTADIVRSLGVSLTTSLDGRAAQLNLGAALASGEFLLFLHADTRLPANFTELVRQTLQPADIAAAAFQFKLNERSWPLRFVEWGTNLRAKWLQAPYGDQAIFTRATAFWSVGGFPDVPILDDLLFIQQARKAGRIAIAPAPAVTSARRWSRIGVLKTFWINQKILFAHRLGVPLQTLADWYRHPPAL